MRNLKKVLSLVLALAMVLSICMVGAGAVNYDDFTDEAEIAENKKQAVETLVSLNVILGYNGGDTFAPTANVTRAEMSTMICRVLAGGDNMIVDATKPVPTYADIDGHWAETYIEYCTSLGIVSGKSPSSFDPDADVTAAEAAKMVMTTLGYNADIEQFKGIGWDINVMAKANTLLLLNNLQGEISASVPATRQQVAQLLFNALTAFMVQNYNGTMANTWVGSGADAYHQTLLESKFNVEKVTGVVEANEYADLYAPTPLRAGTTRLNVMDVNNDITGTKRTINLSTTLDQIGHSVIVYCDKTTQRVVYGNTQDTGLNNFKEFTNKMELTRGGDAPYSTAELKDAEYFVNFGDSLAVTGDVARYFEIELTEVELENGEPKLYTVGNDTQIIKLETTDPDVRVDIYRVGRTLDTNEYKDMKTNVETLIDMEDKRQAPEADATNGIEAYTYHKGDAIKVGDSWYVPTAFEGRVGEDRDVTHKVEYSRFTGFRNYYLTNIDNYNVATIDGNENGNYLKCVDANGDGLVDYVLKTVYALARVNAVAKNGNVTVTVTGNEGSSLVETDKKASDNETPIYEIDAKDLSCADELSKDDVVVYTLIDGIFYANLAEVLTDVASDVDYKRDQITVDGTVYDQSGIINDTEMWDQLDDVIEEDVQYNFYFDNYGYIRAYEEALATKNLVLLTAANAYKQHTSSKTQFAVEAYLDGKITGIDLTSKSDTAHFLKDIDNSRTDDWDNLRPVDMLDKDYEHSVIEGVDTATRDSVTNMGAYVMTDDNTMTLQHVEKSSNKDIVRLFALDLQKVDNKTRELLVNETTGDDIYANRSASDQTTTMSGIYDRTTVDNNKVIYTNKSTVFYIVTIEKDGHRHDVKTVRTYTGFNNLPGTFEASDIYAMYAVGTLTRRTSQEQPYYVANAVVIECTGRARGNYEVGLVTEMATGTLSSSFTLETITETIKNEPVKTNKDNAADFVAEYNGTTAANTGNSDPANDRMLSALDFYRVFDTDPKSYELIREDYIAPLALDSESGEYTGYTAEGIFADEVYAEHNLNGYRTEKNGWIDLDNVPVYQLDLTNRGRNIETKLIEDFDVENSVSHKLIWVQKSSTNKNVLFAIDVTMSFQDRNGNIEHVTGGVRPVTYRYNSDLLFNLYTRIYQDNNRVTGSGTDTKVQDALAAANAAIEANDLDAMNKALATLNGLTGLTAAEGQQVTAKIAELNAAIANQALNAAKKESKDNLKNFLEIIAPDFVRNEENPDATAWPKTNRMVNFIENIINTRTTAADARAVFTYDATADEKYGSMAYDNTDSAWSSPINDILTASASGWLKADLMTAVNEDGTDLANAIRDNGYALDGVMTSSYDQSEFTKADYEALTEIVDTAKADMAKAVNATEATAIADKAVADLAKKALDIAAAKLGTSIELANGATMDADAIFAAVNTKLDITGASYAGITKLTAAEVTNLEVYADSGTATITLKSVSGNQTKTIDNVTITIAPAP